jgi:hypothetical protein
MLIVAVMVSAVFYYIYPFSYIQNIASKDDVSIALEMTERFGPTLDANEFEETAVWLNDLYRQADEIVRTDPEIAQLGFSTFQALLEARDEMDDNFPREEDGSIDTNKWPVELKELDNAFWQIWNTRLEPEHHGGLGYCIQELEQRIRPFYITRVLDNSYGEVKDGIMFSDAWVELRGFVSFGLAVVALLIAVLLAPMLTRDRMARMDAQQTASRRGRRIYISQFWAAILSSFLAVTVLLVSFAVLLFVGTGLWDMRNNPASSFMNFFMHVSTTQTLGQYLMSVTGYAYALGLSTAAIMFCLSGCSRSIATMVINATLLPLVAGIFFGTVLTWDNERIGSKPIVVSIIGLIVALRFLWRRRKVEL